MHDWDTEFNSIVQGLQSKNPELQINRVIWRLNEAAMYLSRLVQYRGLGKEIKLDEVLMDALPVLGALAAEIGGVLQEQEYSLVEEAEEKQEEFCLECLENDVLEYWTGHDDEEDDEGE